MIVNIRGTNGSGKSTLARSFFNGDVTQAATVVELGSYPQKRGPKIIPGYVSYGGVVLVGAYDTDCGGCDAIPTQDLIKSCVREATKHGKHVVFEGVLVSTIFQGYLDLSRQLVAEGHDYMWAYLDTPLELCLERIQRRNGGKEIKQRLVADKIKSIGSTAAKARFAGEHVEVLKWDHGPSVVLQQLMGVP